MRPIRFLGIGWVVRPVCPDSGQSRLGKTANWFSVIHFSSV